ncbi:NADH dehydrogenase Fe-S protein subunit 2 ndufs2 [Cichlidogyrus casuarinus]|uniref:NADH dehydrogenase Fe-S protein subunit 2 ndufs2 n=1 Tax=Cichlidogyrus casuarinus TaxID=1844966 RepID=A0ABD2QKW3_9PLAT
MSLEELLGRTKAEVKYLPDCLIKYERYIVARKSLNDKSDNLNLIEEEVTHSFEQAAKNCTHLSNNLMEIPATKRNQVRMSIDQIKYELKLLRGSFDALQKRKDVLEQDLRNREELLNFDFAPNSVLHNRAGASRGDTVLQLDAEIDHHNRLSNVGSRLDEMISMGQASLSGLREQGISLKDARRKVLDLAKSLGLSNTVMRLIERRTKEDKILFWCLAIGSLILMLLIWKFFRA